MSRKYITPQICVLEMGDEPFLTVVNGSANTKQVIGITHGGYATDQYRAGAKGITIVDMDDDDDW